MENAPRRFNLVEEAWIPVVDVGRVSLRRLFSDPSLRALGGNPIQKISLMKLLLAIAQAACTPKDDEEWKALGAGGLAEKALAYLEEKKDLFWLYGERPFLQMPGIGKIIEKRKEAIRLKAKKPKELEKMMLETRPREPGSGDYPDLPADNNTVLSQREKGMRMDDGDRALFLLTLMPFALAGKQIDPGILLDPDYPLKGVVAKVGPSLGRACYLHTFVTAPTLIETIYINLFTDDKIRGLCHFEEGLGVAPWEKMPQSEGCDTGKRLKKSLMGALVPISRFALYVEDGLYYTEGIQFPNHKDGWFEPTMAVKHSDKGIHVLQARIDKRPWRELTALMSYVGGQGDYDCPQLQYGIQRAKVSSLDGVIVWSGGMDVSGDPFGQKVKGVDDYIESQVRLNSQWLGEAWFAILKLEMGILEEMGNASYGAVMGYYKHFKMDGKKHAAGASNLYWQLAERKFQELVDACNEPEEGATVALRRVFAGYVQRAYDAHAPRETARQLEAWAAHRPNLGKFLATAE